jgi:hypothetical protein
MQALTGYPVSSLQLNRSFRPMTNGRHRNMRMRLKDINWSIKKLADGTTKTYYEDLLLRLEGRPSHRR